MTEGIGDHAWLATGIGSLPHVEAEPAIRLITDTMPDLPHWPQLPRRGPGEGFARQYLGALLDVGLIEIEPGDRVRYRPGGDWSDRLAALYAGYLDAVERGDAGAFGFSDGSAAGFELCMSHVRGMGGGLIKGQVSGPLTVGFSISDQNMRVAWYDEQMRDALIRALIGHALWQTGRLRDTGRTPLVFVDEPGLYMYGQSSFVSLDRDDLISALSEILSAIRAGGALTGIHVCSGCDWSIPLSCPIDVLSCDSFNFMTSLLPYAVELGGFLDRGGALAWGIVPTAGVEDWDIQGLVDRFEGCVSMLGRHGIDPGLIRARSLITPSCGTGTLDVKTAQRVYCLTAGVRDALRDRYGRGR